MPIENIETVNQTIAKVSQQPLFHLNNVIVAGVIKVKHPLLDKSLLIIGFIIEDDSFNENNFQITGMKISYKAMNSNNYYVTNEIIYPKIIIDNKQTPFFELFSNLDKIVWRYDTDRCTIDKSHPGCKFEYYMFDKVNGQNPVCSANEIYAVCKYIEDGVFKYALFNFHELIPES